MKFKHLLLILLLAALCPWTANAQTTETIGTGTSTTAFVFPGASKYRYTVSLYRPNEVADCLNHDFDLSSIAYDVVRYYSATIDELTFWVKDVDESDYENQGYLWYTNTFSQYIEGATQVYSTQTPFNLTEGWNTFNFTTNFSHQAGKALLVAVRGVCNNNNSSSNPYCHGHNTIDGASLWYQQSNSTDPGLDTPGYNTSSDRANIQLGVTYSSAFPSDLTVTYPTCDATEVTLGWTENGEATAWQICLNDDETNLIAATTNPFTLTNLTPETPYTAKVRANYGDTQSSWSSPVSFIPTFKTLIGTGGEFITVLPSDPSKKYSLTQQIYTPAELGTAADIASIDFYNQGDLETTRNLQIYMTHTDQNEFSNWLNDDWIGVASGDLVFSGTVNFVKDAWTSIVLDTPFSYNGTQNVVITVDDNTGTAPNMSFYGDYLFLCYGSQSYQTKFYAGYDNYDPTNNPGNSISILYLKNHIRVLKVQPPTGLTVSNITSEGATLSWTDNSCATAWQICLNGDETNLIDVTENPYTLTNLTPETPYTAKVRANYGVAHNDWTNEVNFTTQESCPTPTNLTAGNIGLYTADLSWTGLPEVESYTVTYKPVLILYEDFENFAGFGDGEDDWTNSNYCVFVGGNSLVQGLPGSMECCVLGCGENSFLISPELPTDGLTLEFYYKIRNSDYPVIFQVGFSSTDKDIASFTFGDEIPYGDSEWHLHTTGVPPGTKYICWKTSNTTYIDDIMVYPDGYDAASEWQTQSVAGNAYQVGATLTGLAPGNLYEAYVYPDCNPDKESDRLHFMTEDPCASPINFTVGNVGTTTADFNWTGSPYTESFTVQYRALPFYTEGFEDGIGDWTLVDCHEYSDVTPPNGGYSGLQMFEFYYDFDQSGLPPQYLISPELTGLTQGMKLEFYYRENMWWTDVFQVGFSTTDNQPESFIFDDEISGFEVRQWHFFSKRIPAGTKYICWKLLPPIDDHCRILDIDDIVIGMETSVGEWQTATVAGNAAEVSATLTGFMSSSPYEARVYPDCNPDRKSQPVYFTTEEDPCYLPINLTAHNITHTTADLNWMAGTEVDSYTVKYRTTSTPAGEWQTANVAGNAAEANATLTSLMRDTPYEVFVYPDCNPDKVSETVCFKTIEDCPRPDHLIASHIGTTTVDLNWTGDPEVESYTVNYRTNALFSEGFEDGLDDWTLRDCASNTGISADGAHSGNAGFRFYFNTNPPQYLISPQLSGITEGMKLEFYYKNQRTIYPETFQVGFSTTDNATESFTFGDEYTVSDEHWHLYSETIPAGTKYICWKLNSNYQYYLFIDDIAVSTEIPAGAWQTATVAGHVNEVSAILNGLMPSASYEAHVYPDCDPDKVSETLYFTTALPFYASDFESGCDWTLVNGNLTNKWTWGTAAHNGEGTHGLYISNDGGTTNAYNKSSEATVYAYKTFNFEAGVYNFSYDWLAIGESSYDFLRVALVPANVSLAAGTALPSGFNSNVLPEGWIALDGGSKLNMAIDWQTAYYEVEVPTAGEYKMVFAWRNDNSDGSNPPAAIDNVFIDVVTCPTPVNLTVSNLTATTADLSWSASMPTDSYTVNYRTAQSVNAIFSEGFEDGLDDWTLRDCASNTGISADGAHSGNAGFRFYYNTNPPQYLISPQLSGITEGMKLEFYYKNQQTIYPETFQVGFSTTDNATESFTFGDEYTVSDEHWHLYSETIPAGTKYICWKLNSNYQYYLFIDDIAVGTEIPAGPWQTATVAGGTVEVSASITGLSPETSYEVHVYPDCNPDKVSEPVYFTTLEQTTVTQTIALQTGWNWVSIYVDIALNDLRAALVEALPGTVITIKQQNGTTSYDSARHRWIGNITWDLSQMYEIKITASCEITLEGARISPSEHTVTIKSGNNWIAFPFDTSMSVTNAFAGFAVNGDMIKSKDGTTTYTRGRWVGTSLTTLEPGKGYVYKSAVSSDRTFSFPTGSK